MTDAAKPVVLHATAVTVCGRGLLIRGATGSGKSSIALELMSRGALLISDDRVKVDPQEDGAPWLSAPRTIAGLIEARGLGILHAEVADGAPLAAILDLDEMETHRLPPVRESMLMNVSVPLLHNSASPYFAAAVMQYLKGGRKE
ncbi:HPr kinase/phosphorylase [Primorskyibacter sp. 2E107]|uniref:HPr kinase/phosphorylase n=1 Tax=Primorskyibacter sp. 2E107 TaxID=3403458 RepID=UPI003AF5DFBF